MSQKNNKDMLFLGEQYTGDCGSRKGAGVYEIIHGHYGNWRGFSRILGVHDAFFVSYFFGHISFLVFGILGFPHLLEMEHDIYIYLYIQPLSIVSLLPKTNLESLTKTMLISVPCFCMIDCLL